MALWAKKLALRALVPCVVSLAGCSVSGTPPTGFHPGIQGLLFRSVVPTFGIETGGWNLEIYGKGFTQQTSVALDGVSCSLLLYLSPEHLRCVVPALAAGLADLTFTDPDGQNLLLENAVLLVASAPGAPTVTNVSPPAGALAGGSAVTITGTNFVTGAVVDFGGSPCNTVVVATTSSITCTTTAHAAGAVLVTVTNPDSQAGTLPGGFTYQAAPTVGGVAPGVGPLAGGTPVTVSGTGFLAGATVSFGGSAATGVTVVNATTITCNTPAHAAGTVAVSVTNTDTQNGSSPGAFTYQPAPTVGSVAPPAGDPSGGTNVTISGTGFLPGASVDFGPNPCTSITVVNATTITCTTPAHAAGSVGVTVTNADTQSDTLPNGFTYGTAPGVSMVTPSDGPLAGGTPISISGANFAIGAAVDLGGNACTSIVVVNATTITCTTAAHAAGPVTVTVTNVDTQSGSLPSGFTYRPAPTAGPVAPAFGPIGGGTAVTIFGADFYAGATVSLGGANCTGVVVVDPTQITCTTSAHAAGIVGVTVTNADGQSDTFPTAFQYRPPPTVGSVTPNVGSTSGGTAVTISGTGFIIGATASFGGSNCSSLTVVNATTITCTTTAHAAGAAGVTVTNSDGQSDTLPGGYTYQPAPTVASIAPLAGALGGGTVITLTGTGFLTGATVDLGGSACTGVTVVNATTITCTTPAHAAGTVSATVTNTDTQSGTGGSFTYQAAPTVSGVAPNTGSLAGGTPVTITGTGFLAGATADFGGSNCGTLVVVNATTITCTTSAHALGTVNVTVTNADTQSGTGIGAFAYVSPSLFFETPVLASDPTTFDQFGTSVAMSGTTFLVGSPGLGNGGAYLYRYDPSSFTWLETKLTASAPTVERFGWSVGISETTAIVGAYANAALGMNAGKAYIFRFDPSTNLWAEQALLASDGTASDNFGWAVDIDGTTAVVSARGDDPNGVGSGSAYIFRFDPLLNSWVETKIVPSDGAAGDDFGSSVAISGNTVVVGAYNGASGAGAAYAFQYDPSSNTWVETKFVASDSVTMDYYGRRVAVAGTHILIGAPLQNTSSGAAYLYRFDPSSNTWLETKFLASDTQNNWGFGYDVAIANATLVVGAPGADSVGAAYVYRFDPTANNWQESKIVSSNPGTSVAFGTTVALSGTRILASEPTNAESGTSAGKVTLYEIDPSLDTVAWAENKLIASDGASTDSFGLNVAIAESLVVIGAPYDDDLGINSGAAYLYRLDPSTNTWMETKFLASDGAPNDAFGFGVGASSTEFIVGTFTTSTPGAAYVYRFDPSTNLWFETKLTASDGVTNDQFGRSVAIDGNIAVVGATLNDAGAVDSGAAYVYQYDAGSGLWEETKFSMSDPATGDAFGFGVAVSGTTVVVGAPAKLIARGKVYVFRLDPTSNLWDETGITASDQVTNEYFGWSVAVSGTTVLVGAPYQNSSTGAAYFYQFDPSSNTWQETKLLSSAPAVGNLYGFDVGLSHALAVVGEYNRDPGRAYIYRYDPTSHLWAETFFSASDGVSDDWFGYSAGISETTAVVGRPVEDTNGPNAGAAYIYRLDPVP